MKSVQGIPSSGSVPFMFGALDAVALPGPVLRRLLSDVGMSPAASRTLLARLRARGDLAVTHHGRVGIYRLAGTMRRRFEFLRTGPEPRPWGGAFGLVIYDIPESERAMKDRLRHVADRAGLGTLRSGVLISAEPAVAADVVDRVRPGLLPHGDPADSGETEPVGLVLESGTLELPTVRARSVAATAWDLPHRSQAFAEQLTMIEHIIEADVPTDPSTAFRRLYDAYLGTVQTRLLDPDLPAELLPADWKASELVRAIGQLIQRWQIPLDAHIDAAIDATAHRDLVERAEYEHP